MGDLLHVLIAKANYWVYILLMMIGLYAVIAKRNLLKKIIGMNIFQTAVILFFISIGAKKDATIPIIEHAHHTAGDTIRAADYINPLPHVLMLTAIVVAVATLGVALALVTRIFQQLHTLEEKEIITRLTEEQGSPHW
jgi:multicomponent Na+:H+ antiporter subunit C